MRRCGSTGDRRIQPHLRLAMPSAAKLWHMVVVRSHMGSRRTGSRQQTAGKGAVEISQRIPGVKLMSWRSFLCCLALNSLDRQTRMQDPAMLVRIYDAHIYSELSNSLARFCLSGIIYQVPGIKYVDGLRERSDRACYHTAARQLFVCCTTR